MIDFWAFTIAGVVTGGIFAVAASGLVVTYTTSGIFNFAHGAIGMLAAFTYWELRVNQSWPAPIALVVVLLILAPLFGMFLERTLMRQLHGASTGVTLVVTLALLVLMVGIGQTIWSPAEARQLPRFFADNDVALAGLRVNYHQIIVVAVAALIAGALRLLLFHTRVGVTMRAVVDDRELSGLNGASPERAAQLSWIIGAVLAAVAGILIAPLIRLEQLQLTLLVVTAYAAAVLGRLRSLPLTFIGALILGLLQSYAIGYGGRFPLFGELRPVLPTLFLFAVLVFLPQARLRAGRLVGVRAPRVPSFRESLVAATVFVAVMGVLSTQLSAFWLFNVSSALVIALVLLSLVVLTGYAGQISLMQMGFVGVGALAMGRLVGDGGPFGLLAAALVAGALGALVALPALRLQDLYLALATLALAVFGQWAFDQTWMFGRGGILEVERLNAFGLSFRSEQSQVVLLGVAFAAMSMFVLAIRRGPFGRRLAAMRDSPVACATLGLDLVGTKTAVFALAAAMAGVAGALFGSVRGSVSAADFLMMQSLLVFLIAVVGGINTVTGAALGGAFLMLMPELAEMLDIEHIAPMLIGLAAIGLAHNPNGVAGNFADIADAIRHRRAATRPPLEGEMAVRASDARPEAPTGTGEVPHVEEEKVGVP